MHAHRRTRARVPVLTAAGLAALGLVLVPTSASAGAPLVVQGEGVNVVCEGPLGDGSVNMTLDSNTDQVGGGNRADIVVWDATGTVVLRSEERTGSLVREGGSLTGALPLLDVDGMPAGSAPFSVSVTPVGEPTTEDTLEQVGNVRQETSRTRQAAVGSGTVQVSGTAVALDCSGQQQSWMIRTTQPDAATQHLEHLNLWCTTILPDGRLVEVTVASVWHDLVAVSVSDAEDGVGGEVMGAVITRRDVAASVPLYSRDEVEVGQALVALHIDAVTGREHFRQLQAHRTQYWLKETVVGSGTVQLPGGGTVAVPCDGLRTSVHEVATSPAGPKPSGRTPANDAESGAVLLRPGDRSSAQTGGTAADPEADLWCYDNEPEDPGYYPKHTVWYRFVGTGQPMTVDTAGSSYNTTLAVYRTEGGTLQRVACADDEAPPVTTLQAYATIDTQEGREYLVQVGGIGGEYGLLKMALR